jgi:type I restriction enzyme, R subunit
MTEIRPQVPADIQRRLMVECGHRCACCGEATSLEKAHIIPWSAKQDHKAENLVVLCAVCHQRSHDEKWDRKTLHEYKKRPWVARYRSQPDGSPPAIAEFQLDLFLDNFGTEERSRFLAAVSAALDICPKDAVILSIRPGSVLVYVQLPAASVEALKKDQEIQKSLQELAAPLRIERIDFVEPELPRAPKSFTEGSTVERLLIDQARRIGWTYITGPQVPRQTSDTMVETWVREALIKLNPEVAAQPDRADEVIYNLRACILSVQSDGLVRANENFTAWLRGEKTMPFGPNGEHVPVLLVDAVNPTNNQLTVCNQWIFQAGAVEKRFDVVFLVNGIPLVIGEAKTPTRSAVTWFDGAFQINEIYEKQVPAMFVPNVFSFATEGKLFRYGSIRMSIDMWGPWRERENQQEGQLHHVKATVGSMLRPGVVLDILQNFTLFATDKKHRRIKTICRYQQYFTTNQIVERVVNGFPKKGLIWHFQGSGKSLLMVFASQKLRMHPKLGNPTVIIVVDRTDLDTQITATFNASDVPNMVGVGTREELQRLLAQDVRKVLITTIHKFGEAAGRLNERSNIIVMVDEAHRTQEGDLGRKMREALPNAFLFGMTGTPINRADKNTFWAFGADEDEKGYMSRYSFQDSIRDKATLPLHFEAPEVKLKIDKAAIDQAYQQITDELSEQDRDDLAKRAAKMAVLVKNPERVRAVVNHIVRHFQAKIEPNGFKAEVVTFDRECCVLYKAVMDEMIGPEASAIVMTGSQFDPPEWDEHIRDKDAEEKLLDRFRDPADPLKFVIVTSKLLTGFDAPILQVMYLDKPMKDHNLLQAICRTNRTYGQEKTHGLIVDYIGIFDDVARALDFDEKAVQNVVSNIDDLRRALPKQIHACLAFFQSVDRTIGGYEGLMAAQQCLPNNEVRDKFAGEYSVLGKIWEALSPDPMLSPYQKDYRWLTQVYESVKPPSGNGRLLWHILGAKTISLINENIHVESMHDEVETLVMDADVLEEILKNAEPEKKAREIEIKLSVRLRTHAGDLKFKALAERLEKIRERHEQGFLTSLVFLKAILALAKDVVEAEKEVRPEEERNRAKEALTELFTEVKSKNTHIIVERIVNDIDDIVKKVRFPEWQHTSQGERIVQKELRRTLLKYKLHTDQELFDKA